MKILQLGAGSMGRRRIRDLSRRGDVELAVYDERRDHGDYVRDKWRTRAFGDIDDAMRWNPDVLIISTPPHQHAQYVRLALDNGLHHFSETNIWTPDYREVERTSSKKALVSVVSCSLLFLPVVKELKRIVAEELGGLHSYQMLLSTYMPGWHPGEGEDYYARQRSTAAGRDMVPFELSMLNSVFGTPKCVSGSVGRRGKLQVDSEDTWCLQMVLDNGATGQLTVLMASPAECRAGRCIGDNGISEFDIRSGSISCNLSTVGAPGTYDLGSQENVIEDAYAEEIDTFVDAIICQAQWPYSYHDSSVATAALAAAEISALSGQSVIPDPVVQPGLHPTDYAFVSSNRKGHRGR